VISPEVLELILVIIGVVISALAAIFKKKWSFIMDKFTKFVNVVRKIDELEDVQTEILARLEILIEKVKKGESITDEDIDKLFKKLAEKYMKTKELKAAIEELV